MESWEVVFRWIFFSSGDSVLLRDGGGEDILFDTRLVRQCSQIHARLSPSLSHFFSCH